MNQDKGKIKLDILHFLENFNVNIGKKLHFIESISTDKDNFNRHFTTSSSTEFVLKYFGARLSGARLMFDGKELNYEISLDRIVRFHRQENQITFLEKYSDEVYRRTILKIRD